MFVKMSLPDRLVCFADFVGMNLLARRTPKAPLLFLLPLLNCFLRVCLLTLFAAVLKFFPPRTTSANSRHSWHSCNLWHSKVQQNSTYAFCSWDDIFAKKYDCSSRNNLCKCTDSPSTLSTNTSIEWNIYFSWSNHLVTSFRLEMNVGSILERQIKTSDTDRYKRYFFTARVYQVNVNTMKRIFEQRSELQVAKCLIVHVLFSSYNVSRLELRKKRKATEQWSFCVANDILLNQVGVYLYVKRECMRTMSKENCGLWGPFPLNITPNSLPTLLPHSKECKTRSFLCKVKINFFAFFETL